MTDKPTVIIYKESLMQSVISDLATFGFLLLCVWASQGSIWWTFATGTLFLIFICSKAIAATHSGRCLHFYSTAEIQKWIDQQKVIHDNQ